MGGLQVQVPGPTRIPEIQGIINEMKGRVGALKDVVDRTTVRLEVVCKPSEQSPKIVATDTPVSTLISDNLVEILTEINRLVAVLEDTNGRLEI